MKVVIIILLLIAFLFLLPPAIISFSQSEYSVGIILFVLFLGVLGFAFFLRKKTKDAKKTSISTGVPQPLATESHVIDEVKKNHSASPQTAVVVQPEPAPVSIPESITGYERKYIYDDVLVAGSNHYDTSFVSVGGVVDFLPEPENEYDPKAVSVMLDGKKIGHLPKGRLQQMFFDFRDRGGDVYARIGSVSSEQIEMILGYYERVDTDYEKQVKSGVSGKSFRLSGNRNEKMQDNIAMTHVGEEVEADYDYEKEKYLAVCGLEIGYFPQTAESYLENDFKAFVEKITEDENGKYSVSVIVFPE